MVDASGDALAHMQEIAAQGYPRVQYRDGRPLLLSRPERSSQTRRHLDWSAVGHLRTTASLSRNAPSHRVMRHSKAAPFFLVERGVVAPPRWAAQRPVYAERVAEVAGSILAADLAPTEATRQLSHVARAAVPEVRRCRLPAGSRVFA